MSFKGFERPTYTQVPNDYLNYTISSECDLTALEMRIMNFFFRETFGWQDRTSQLVASVTDFQAMFGIQKRKSVTDALDRLTKDKNFLQSVQIKNLSVRTRKNIQAVMNKTLHPAQKLYRLNLKEVKDKNWDNVRNWHNSESKAIRQEFLLVKKAKAEANQIDNGYQSVPIEIEPNGYQSVPINGYQSVPINEAETLEPVEVEATLNKGLNKDLNKVLNKNIYLSGIAESNLLPTTKKILLGKIDRLIFHSITIEELENHLKAKSQLVNENQYLSCLKRALDLQKEPIQSFEAFMDVVITNEVKTQNKAKIEANSPIKPIRTEKVFEYMNDEEVKMLPAEEIEKQNKELEDLIKSLGDRK